MSMLERITRYNHGGWPRRDIPKLNIKPKPAPISDDGLDRGIFSRRRDIMNQVLSPTIRHFGLDGSNSLPFSRPPPSPRARSPHSLASYEPELNWDQDALLELSDQIRESLQRTKSVHPHGDKLSAFLEAALRDVELRPGRPTLDFETIEYARLDKLIADILTTTEKVRISSNANCVKGADGWGGGGGGGVAVGGSKIEIGEAMQTGTGKLGPCLSRYRADVANAKTLLRAWRRRFREQYFMMDQRRASVLVREGRLKDVSFNNSLACELGKWYWYTKVSGPVSELEGNLHFDPGHWWLNITCAERDGMVASSFETPTKGRYGINTLPLLTGQEEMVRANTYKYVREGRAADMHIALISQVGRQIRVLRGYRLKSIVAPQAGVRYDGLFTIKQYGCKQDSKTGLYRLELTLERVPDQNKSLEEIKSIPRPSQLDDWNLYEKLEGDKIKLVQGETSYLEWKLRRQEEKIDREDWRRARLFRASFSQ
ncbi:PUA-like domain-containing protein [Hypoxylon sp. FL1857]|nr:PUA-like domain-containing protein [Hypoxylon sp. FL1857]